MNILYVSSGGRRIYGGEKWIYHLCKYINKENFQIQIILGTAGELGDAVQPFGIPSKIININHLIAKPRIRVISTFFNLMFSAMKLDHHIQKHDVDLIHVFDGKALEASYIASRLSGIPLVVTIQLAIKFPPLHNKMLSRSTKVVAVSNACHEQLVNSGVPEVKIVDISTGIEIDKYQSENGYKIRQEFNLPLKAPVVGIVASLDKNKRQDLFLKAASIVFRQVPEAYFLLVGNDKSAKEGELGDYYIYLNNLALELGIKENVIFAGFRDDVSEILQLIDIFVLCSNSEAYPVTIMEAMASGTPVVATRVGGVVDLVEDGNNGILVPPGDHRVLSEAILRLLKDRQLLSRMGQQAKYTAVSRFSIETALKRTETLYLDILQKTI